MEWIINQIGGTLRVLCNPVLSKTERFWYVVKRKRLGLNVGVPSVREKKK